MKDWEKRVAYVSHSMDAGNMLALWLDHRPSCDKDQKDPDGWVTGVSGTDYEAERLAELAKAPGARIVKTHGAAAEWWDKIDRGRKLKSSKERNAKHKNAQSLFDIPEDIEKLGCEVGYQRTRLKTGTR